MTNYQKRPVPGWDGFAVDESGHISGPTNVLPFLNADGTMSVTLYGPGGRQQTFRRGALVLESFGFPTSDEYPFVVHKGQRSNDALSNLKLSATPEDTGPKSVRWVNGVRTVTEAETGSGPDTGPAFNLKKPRRRFL